MSTILAQNPTTPLPRPQHLHYRWVGLTKMWCIQPNCDGEHHFYCGCR